LQLRAIAVAPGYVTSGVASADFALVQQAPAPSFSVASGSYSTAQVVTLSDSTPYFGKIYYTTDGSDPTTSGTATQYTQPLTVSSSETINTIEVIPGWAVYEGSASTYDGMATPGPSIPSPVATAVYIINLPVAAMPAFSVPAGTYASIQTVTLSDSTPGATIYYTTDGTTPTTSSTQYNGPITVSATETIEAIAVASGYANSAVASVTYTLAPGFTANPGGTTSLSLSPGATTGNTATISVVGVNGFSGIVKLACNVTTSITNVSDMPTCSLNPTSLTISGATAQTSTLTVTTTAVSSATNEMKKLLWPSAGGTALAFLLFFVAPKRRPGWSTLFGLLALVGVIGMAGCSDGGSSGGGGGTGGNPGTTAGTYTISVTGTSGTTSSTVGSVTLTVQ
jgi:hypothetical protein